ncbi:MAG: hypothetical protein A4S09_06000 [Proteobacteria bacterium SG_bin7]|nr:MAG: hypothetical protein A4S09_06000 [Proteobacteria bacterium SG_bin7]
MTTCRQFFLHVNKFWLLVITVAFSAYADEKSYLDYDEVACENLRSPDCYREVICNINFQTQKQKSPLERVECLSNPKDFYKFSSVNGYTKIGYGTKKAKTTVVFIHGVLGNSSQFYAMINEIFESARTNTIELTLPGHSRAFSGGTYSTSVEETKQFSSFENWVIAVEETVKIAKQLGQKTIIVGQSTGGLLAVDVALKYPHLVDALVLIEPALKVQGLINVGSCLSKIIPDIIVSGVAKLFGQHVPDTMSVEMGCEVQKLADQVFPPDKSHEGIAANVQVPVLLFNNEQDKIVSPEANRKFYSGLKNAKEYISINKEGSLGHGTVTFSHAAFLVEAISKFVLIHKLESELAKIHGKKIYERIEEIISTIIRDQVLKKSVFLDKVFSLRDDFCQIAVLFGETCPKFEEALKVAVSFYSSILAHKQILGDEFTRSKFNVELPSDENALFLQKLQYLAAVKAKLYDSFW